MQIQRASFLLILFIALAVTSASTIHKDFHFLEYTIRNTYNYTIKVHRHGTPFGDYAGFIHCELNDSKLPYQGYYGYYDNSPEGAYLILSPGEVKTAKFYLEENFDLSAMGRYNVWFEESVKFEEEESRQFQADDFINISLSRYEFDSHQTEGKLSSAFLPQEQNISQIPQKFIPFSNNFTFFKNQSGSLFSEFFSHDESPEEEEARFNALPSYQQNIIDSLRVRTENNPITATLKKALVEFSGPLTYPPLYRKWFDAQANNFTHLTQVKTNFEGMYNRSKQVQVKMSDVDKFSKCKDGNSFAYAKPDTAKLSVFLCDRFFRQDIPFMGSFYKTESILQLGQVNMVIHEISHLVGVTLGDAGTKEFYTRTVCLGNAKSNPAITVINAQNYGFFANNLPVKISMKSIFDYGLRVENDYLYSDKNVALNLVFDCIGEFPKCQLQEVVSKKNLDYEHMWLPWKKDKIMLSKDDTEWLFHYEGNGASTLAYGRLKDRVKLEDNQLVEDSVFTERDYTALWVVTIDYYQPKIRTIKLQDRSKGTVFEAESGVKEDSRVICKGGGADLSFVLLGPKNQCLFRVFNKNNLFLGSTSWDKVILKDTPEFWGYEQEEKNEDLSENYSLENHEKWWKDAVYCDDYVYSDGYSLRKFSFIDVQLN